MKTKIALLAIFVSAFSLQLSGFSQGSLTPPGSPAPTMKTLSQIQPSTPITNGGFIITTPGSYYFTGDLSVTITSAPAIMIAANGVTIDLNGFELTGLDANTNAGIAVTGGTYVNICIRNGSIRFISPGPGIDAAAANNSRFEDLRIANSGSDGLRVGSGCAVKGCQFQSNGGAGLSMGTASVAKDCTASQNATGISVGNGGAAIQCIVFSNKFDGIVTGQGCTVADCTAHFNGTDGVGAEQGTTIRSCTASYNGNYGINVRDFCSIIGCTVRTNVLGGINVGAPYQGASILDCTAGYNGGPGISANQACTISRCTATANGVGIQIGSACQVIQNHTFGNGPNPFDDFFDGIFATGARNLIADNYCSENIDVGVFASTNNLVVRNTMANGFALIVPFGGPESIGDTLQTRSLGQYDITNTNPYINWEP